jgi:ABC-2 type transport system permease protein
VSDLRLTLRQVRFTNTAFWRNPAAAFFTIVFPLMFLVIFTTLFGNAEVVLPGPDGEPMVVNQSTFYVAAMAAFAVITACYTNLAIGVCFQRDAGVLKRIRGTPLPGPAYLSARVVHAMVVAVLLVAVTAVFGAAFYGSDLPAGVDLLVFVVVVVVGAASFAALGLAVTALVPNADAAPPVVNVTILPILFLSDIFIPLGEDPPTWVDLVGTIFPVKHFSQAMQAGFIGTEFEWSDVVVVAVWGVIGLLLAARSFSWEPRR